MNFIATFFPDHFNQANRRGVVAGVLVSALATIALFKVRPPSRERSRKTIARLESYSNNVRYKEADAVSFFDILPKEQLQNSDEIFTGENSLAVVRFLNSNTLLKIPSSSLVKIEDGTNGEAIEIKEGVIDIVVGKDQSISLNSNGVKHLISSTQKDSIVKAYYSTGELHLLTSDKGVKVSNVSGTSELTIHQDAALSSLGRLNESKLIIFFPTPGVVLENSEGLKISTNLKSKYSVTLFKNADFSGVSYETKFEGQSYDWKILLEEGDYFLKIEDKNDSKIIPITLRSKYKVDGFVPGDGEFLNIYPMEKTTLRWNPLPVNSYKVLIRDDKKHEKTYITRTNQLQTENLKGSDIEWSVLPEITKGKYSNLKKTNKAGLKFNGKIELLGLPGQNQFSSSAKYIDFKWKSPLGNQFLVNITELKTNKDILNKQVNDLYIRVPSFSAGPYKLEISAVDYPSLQKIEYNFKIVSPLLSWHSDLQQEIRSIEQDYEILLQYKENFPINQSAKLHIKYLPVKGSLVEKIVQLENAQKIKLEGFGQHCFKAQLLSPMEYFSDSDNYCLKLIQIPVFNPLPRARDNIMPNSKHEGLDSYKILVPNIPKAVKYQFEIYKDLSEKTLVYTINSKKPEVFWTTNRSGIYYLKYKVFDEKNRGSSFSPFSKLIFPISPLSEW